MVCALTGNMHVRGLAGAGYRGTYVLDVSEVYQIVSETEEHFVLKPASSTSSSPVYVIHCGSHTLSMYTEAVQLAQVNPSNTDGGSYSDYPSFQTAKDLVPTILQDTSIFLYFQHHAILWSLDSR